ncbi:hypothetical protein CLMAG_16620 [Clostridium magnum DSM 2767]|uniref:Uncharacterized protein n=1 Tax=Clostridium magnum DSM 2767 TaxID=1121326 RepID=A0A161XC19_9CLOT|nr:hypothetical protein CLMAG_16620 [Clostridium magnum DSM 2767]
MDYLEWKNYLQNLINKYDKQGYDKLHLMKEYGLTFGH